jgi:hypothetical protein
MQTIKSINSVSLEMALVAILFDKPEEKGAAVLALK